jgi:hypothetical protein
MTVNVEGSGLMSGLVGAESNDSGSSGSSGSDGKQAKAAEPSSSSASAGTAGGTGSTGTAETAETAVGEDGSSDSGSGSVRRRGKVRIWFSALLRSATALVLTIVILALCAGVADVVLHVTRHTSSNSASFAGVTAVDVVLDGDVSLNVVGQTNGDATATLATVNTSTPFDDPTRSASVVGGTLYLTERCPDSRCTSQLTLTLNTNDQVNIVAGNALRLTDAVIDIRGIDGQASVQADPGTLIVTNTIVSGAVIGIVECDTQVDCQGVTTPAGTDRGTSAVDG